MWSLRLEVGIRLMCECCSIHVFYEGKLQKNLKAIKNKAMYFGEV